MDLWTKLGGNNIDINDIHYLTYANMRMVLNEKDNNKEAFELYDKFISISSQFVKDLALPDNSISLAFVIGQLIKMGVFSSNNKYIEECKHDTFYTKEGFDIVLGHGVCRHFAAFLKDIFEKLEIFNQKYTCVDKDILIPQKLNGKTRHVANVIKYNEKCYVYDSYNNKIFNFIMPNVVLDLEKHFYLVYKPELLMWDEALTKEDIIERLQMYKSSCKSYLNYKDYYEIKMESFANLEKNIKLIDDFTGDTYDIKQKILSKTI